MRRAGRRLGHVEVYVDVVAVEVEVVVVVAVGGDSRRLRIVFRLLLTMGEIVGISWKGGGRSE